MVDVRGDELEVEVEGETFTGWEKLELVRQLEAASGTFAVEVSERRPWPILPGHEVRVRLADELLLTGYVDALSAAGSEDRRTFRVSGRDRTADLVDCSEVSEPGEWAGLIVQDLVSAIAEPFGVEIRSEVPRFSQEPFEVFARNPGESAWSAIERACRLRGILAFTAGSGELVLSRPASRIADVELVEGRRGNVKSWSIEVNRRQRFQTYIVRGQRAGGDDAFGEQVAEIEGTSSDPEIDRFRPLLVTAEGAVTFESAQDRANWEATVRAARSATLTVKVQGWRQVPRTGALWRLNELVPCRIPSAQLDQMLLVKGLRFTRDTQEGTTTQIVLTRRDAYTPEPVVDEEEEPFEELLGGEVVGFDG